MNVVYMLGSKLMSYLKWIMIQ